MTKKSLILVFGLFSFFVFASGFSQISAQTVNPLPRGPEEVCRPGTDADDSPLCRDQVEQSRSGANPITGPEGVLTRAIELISVAIGVVSVIVIMVGGFRYVTSSGDSNTINSAKNTILYAVIGLVIAIFARTILAFVIARI